MAWSTSLIIVLVIITRHGSIHTLKEICDLFCGLIFYYIYLIKWQAAKEAKEASEVEDSMASLIAKIQGKGASSESFLDGLAQKYAAKPKGKGKKNK